MNPAETIKNWTTNAKEFYADTRTEMRKVTWPSRQEIMGTTIVVIAAVFFFGFYLWVVDAVLGFGLDRILRYFRVVGGA
jgi:preprotein translocase subunit SecE